MQAKKKRRNSGARTVLYTLAIGIWYYRWYILAVLLGAFFTPMAVKAAYAARGYRATRTLPRAARCECAVSWMKRKSTAKP